VNHRPAKLFTDVPRAPRGIPPANPVLFLTELWPGQNHAIGSEDTGRLDPDTPSVTSHIVRLLSTL
jgi:hypothetical protein